MNKGVIYYTHNDIDPAIFNQVQRQIIKSQLPVVSCSLKPIEFGTNVVLDADKGIMTYFRQIVLALETSNSDYVFFCEHDVLYHHSHFYFEPQKDDTFYYNANVWKWDYQQDRVIFYDHNASLSGACVNRKLALDFYKKRMDIIYENEYDKLPTDGNPSWARNLGYEPGRRANNKIEYALAEEWFSECPNIDIRHTHNMTPKKMNPDGFVKKPTGWKEDKINNLPGWWDLKNLFNV